jgi:glycosyltransferase involved in cell wall biosynthesis
MNPQVSILVPVYNVSKYIERCVRSLFEQTYDNIEYVFVNDCTPDDSMEILTKVLDDYPQRKSQVRIINFSENRGVTAARNRLVSEISGKYAIFVDSDDYIEKNTVKLLVNEALKTNAEIVAHDFVEEYEDGKTKVLKVFLSDNKAENVKSFLLEKNPHPLYAKLIDSKLFNHPDFKLIPDDMIFWEDFCISMQLIVFAKKITNISVPLYHYVRYNNLSITSSFGKSLKFFESAILRCNFMENFLQKTNYYEENKNDIDFQKVFHKAILMRSANSIALRKKYANLWYNEETEHYCKLKRHERIIIFLVRHRLFGLTQLIYYGTLLFYMIRGSVTKRLIKK